MVSGIGSTSRSIGSALQFIEQTRGDQAVDDTESERRHAKKMAPERNSPSCGISHSRASSSCPPICAKAARMLQLTGPKQRRGRRIAKRQDEQAEQRAAQAHEEARREKVAEQQAAGKDAQAADPGGGDPAVARQDDQRDDVGQAGFDPRQGQRDRRVDQRQADRRRRELRDAMVLGRRRQPDQAAASRTWVRAAAADSYSGRAASRLRSGLRNGSAARNEGDRIAGLELGMQRLDGRRGYLAWRRPT
jgi:hypothetical protein